jgi:hypothetical protein
MKIHYTIQKVNNTPQVVAGEQVGKFFGARINKKYGWMLTHVRSGKLVTTAGFTSVNDLIVLCNLIEYIFNEEELLDIENSFANATGMKKVLVDVLKASCNVARVLDQNDVRAMSLKVGGYE